MHHARSDRHPSPALPPAGTALFTLEEIPFSNAAEAWFWAVQAQIAKAEGARIVAGLGVVRRPCEPGDIIRTVDRLYRRRLLSRDHLHVLVHYGRRMEAPASERWREQRAASLWEDAFAAITPALVDKGIVGAGGGRAAHVLTPWHLYRHLTRGI